jgi:hypothetical protein
MAGLRASIIAAARAELAKQSNPAGPNGPVGQKEGQRFIDKDGRMVRGGYARLQQIYTDAILGFNQQNDATFKAYDNTKPLNRDWCGIFAVSVQRRAGVDISWNLKSGAPAGNGFTPLYLWSRADIKAIPTSQRSAESVYLEPGDIAVIPEANHHFLVVDIDADRKTLRTIEGNTDYQQIAAGVRKVSSLTTIYKLTAETRFPAAVLAPTRDLPAGVAVAGNWEVGVSGSTYHYTFAKNGTVTWGSSPGGNDGAGLWYPSGSGLLKITWTRSGSLELWDLSGGASNVTGTYYYHADPPARLTAKKT